MASSCALVVFICICLLANQRVCNAVSFQNADFESTSYNGNWACVGCSISPSNDAYTGSHSVHVANRKQNSDSVSQNLALQGGRTYKILIYVKLLSNVNTSMYQDVELVAGCKDQHGKDVSISFGHSPHVQHGKWYAVGGVNQIPTGDHNCRIYVQTSAPTEYLADHASLKEVTLDSNWKTAANQRIENMRKAELSIHLAGAVDVSSNVKIEVQQLQNEFAFGGSVHVAMIVNAMYSGFKKVFYDTFEWGVFDNALKWGAMQPRQDVHFYNLNMKALHDLRSHGINVRGHTVFWAEEFYVNDWVKKLNKTQLTTQIQARIKRLIGNTTGLVEHWNVNNDILHGDLFAKHTGDPDITMDMFRQIHAIDSYPKLFLNEHGVLSQCEMAVALMDTAKRYKSAGVPIGGIGVQGHLKQVNLAEIWERLNILGEAGLPIVISELGIHDKNETSKAAKLDDLLTMFFSHPSVEGVIFWDTWDEPVWETDAALFTGWSVTPNAAGRKLQSLLKTQWRTRTTGTIHGTQPWYGRVFKGSYKLTVTHNGKVINTEYFSVSSRGQTVGIHLDGQQNGHPHISHIIVG